MGGGEAEDRLKTSIYWISIQDARPKEDSTDQFLRILTSYLDGWTDFLRIWISGMDGRILRRTLFLRTIKHQMDEIY